MKPKMQGEQQRKVLHKCDEAQNAGRAVKKSPS
ncbi:hypothetical protein J2S19_003397 [Metabacillus malikii]|uniref:Uncharacterized protein n=1 Tax=Metabacillus malikii TaxID=1504265 RepID=A0ABT9ZJG6_9BACI|nr:hypothetical protein [Metabacillus malikii]